METPALVDHAARAYAIAPAYLAAMLGRGPVAFDPEWLAGCGFTGDPTTPEQQAYLTARWIAETLPRYETHEAALIQLGIPDARVVVAKAFPSALRRFWQAVWRR